MSAITYPPLWRPPPLWCPPSLRRPRRWPPAWFTEGKTQRGATGKTKRNASGKAVRNSATDSGCCCSGCSSTGGVCTTLVPPYTNCLTGSPAKFTGTLSGVTLCGCHGGHMLSGDPNGIPFELTQDVCGTTNCLWGHYSTPGPLNAQNWSNENCTGDLQENAQFYISLLKLPTFFSVTAHAVSFDGVQEVIFTGDVNTKECCSTYTIANTWTAEECGASGLVSVGCPTSGTGSALIAGYGGQMTLASGCCACECVTEACDECPSNEDIAANCGHTFHVKFTGEGDDAGDYNLVESGGVFVWDNPAIQVDCITVGDPFLDPPQKKWFMVLYDQETLGVQYVFYADPCACPPTDIAAWINFVDGSHHAGELTLLEYI